MAFPYFFFFLLSVLEDHQNFMQLEAVQWKHPNTVRFSNYNYRLQSPFKWPTVTERGPSDTGRVTSPV